ncbi:class I adenylate-forming enzyme family protein [Iamia majanohamensis]|uniref:Class I adenylate-forming enzyme family protein n=1 Tax=Iamia majanohamensis TaxID=467976 RepID=A0AAE9Y4L6_9ACTN|nr:class I adenylate-forming enzyme family protein [Iamia majanohamensis]WCO66222.1 class I adenylate-forming enzyme family protein [Iamia majanohamensis]
MVLQGPDLAAPADLRGMVAAGAAAHPDRLALASARRRVTWSELDAEVGRWAGALASFGLSPGDRVASLLPNRLDLAVHHLACLRAGLVAVPLNYRYVAPQVDHALAVSGASLLVAHVERAGDLARCRGIADLPAGCAWYEEGEAVPDGGVRLRDRLADGAPPPAAGGPDDPAFVFFTSGSTGPAKGVTHSVATAGWMAASAAAAFEITAEDTFLPASSMSHLGAFLWTMASLSAGAAVVVTRTFDGDEVLPLIREHRPTLMAMIPAALTALVRDHGVTAEDFSSLRLCRSGSDHVPAELEEEFQALTGFPIDEGYGMSEVGLATLNPPGGPIRPGSIGTADAGFALSVRDADGTEVPTGQVGTIWMRTPSATVGYWGDPEATASLFDEDGWLDSGDLARADEDGYLWFFGRAKQVIVHDGSNISPQEVEDALSAHPAVAAVGVVGIHDVVHGEDVRAYVATKEGVPRPTSQDLVRFARERVGYRAPEEVVFLDALPLNPTGKLDRVGLRRLAEEHRNPHRPG